MILYEDIYINKAVYIIKNCLVPVLQSSDNWPTSSPVSVESYLDMSCREVKICYIESYQLVETPVNVQKKKIGYF